MAPSKQVSKRKPAAGLPLAGLVAVLTLMSLELVRSSGPLLDMAYSGGGVTTAAGAALMTYLAPGFVVVVVLLAVRRGSSGPLLLLVGTGLLAGLRLVTQGLEGGARFVVGLTTVAVSIAVLTLAVAILAGRAGGGRTAAGAVSAGAAAGVGLQLALGTWDAYWRHTALGWSVTVAVVGSLVWLAVLAARDPSTSPTRRTGQLWALGPFLALGAMMLANPAFAASQSGLPLALAGPMNASGLLLAGWMVMRSSRRSTTRVRRSWTQRWSGWADAGLLVLLVSGAVSLGGSFPPDAILVLLALLGAQVTAITLLSRALEPAAPTPDDGSPGAAPGTVWFSVAGSACLVGVATIVPLLVYQIDYDIPLGFPNELVLAVTAAALGTASLRRSGPTAVTGAGGARPARRTLLVASCAMVLVGTGIASAAWVSNRNARLVGATAQPADSGEVLSWNVHYGVSPEGSVDLEAVARTIEAHNPDAVLLQEVSRGWVLGGGVDMATWLSNRLGRQFAFAPAADRRFGNAIMSRQEPRDVQVHVLPYGVGPQNRSAVSAQVRVGNSLIRVTSVHLQVRAANTPTRIRQLESLLADLPVREAPGPAMIIGGDLNAEPGRPEIAVLTEAGFVSAIDTAGDRTALTSPTTNPTRRIDWVFGRGMAFSDARVLADARWSDHLPLVVATAP